MKAFKAWAVVNEAEGRVLSIELSSEMAKMAAEDEAWANEGSRIRVVPVMVRPIVQKKRKAKK
jgi:hypothetical protein